ncbi:MarR family transcriptional regulator [Saccharomonospora piscinae]|nr:MarR family transcriptional regulator [Saccharomonospora piscinae]
MADVHPEVEAARQRIGRLARLFHRTLEQVAAAERLSVSDWEALSVVVRARGRCTPTELASALQLTSGTVSTRLNRLVAAGLVEVVEDADGRSRPVTVTEEGHRRWQAATAARTRAERELFAVLSPARTDDLNRLLRTLLHHYETTLGEAPRHDVTDRSSAQSP